LARGLGDQFLLVAVGLKVLKSSITFAGDNSDLIEFLHNRGRDVAVDTIPLDVIKVAKDVFKVKHRKNLSPGCAVVARSVVDVGFIQPRRGDRQ
jgi:hypothetical protein